MKEIKALLLLLSLFIPIVADAMKIETDEIDEFTEQRTLITSWESLCNKKVHVRFRMQNGHQLLDFKMFYDGAVVIGEDEKLMFKSTDDVIGKFTSISIYHGSRGGGATGLMGSGAWGISATYSGELSYFSENIVRLVRVYFTDAYTDLKISDADGKKLVNLYNLFDGAMQKQPGKSAVFANYTITFLKSGNKGKAWDVVEERYIKDASAEDITTIISEWKSQSNERYIYECKIKKE